MQKKHKEYDVAALGEILIDFTDCGLSPYGTRLFSQNPGGAVANVAAAVARLGGHSAFIGRTGEDMHGAFLREVMEKAGVDISGLTTDADHFTTMAFVKLAKDGEREFSFARKNNADTHLTFDAVPKHILENARILHVGSLGLTDEPVRSAQLASIRCAKAHGALLAFDPNYRASLWQTPEQFCSEVKALLPQVDLIKLSDEEIELVTGERVPERAVERLLCMGISVAVVTLGSRGAVAGCLGGDVRCEGISCTPVDATGAGDAFWGGFLLAFLEQNCSPTQMSAEALEKCLRFANGVGAYCVAHFGAISGMPGRDELRVFLQSVENRP